MSVFVVDASVAIKWVLPENDSDVARRLFELPHSWLAPDLFFAEVANIVWKRIRRKELTPEEGRLLLGDVERIAIDAVPCRDLVEDALAIASAAGQTVHDSLYLALAIRMETQWITADERLGNAVAGIEPLASHIAMLATFAVRH